MLNTPPLLLGAALLLWGWQTGFLIFGAIMALLVELSRFTKARWEFSQTDYNRIWNLCAVLFLGIAVYCFASNEGPGSVAAMFDTPAKRTAAFLKTSRSILVLFQWLPMIFFPVMAAQAYGTKEKIDLSTFSWLLRRRLRRRKGSGAAGNRPVLADQSASSLNVAFVYFGLCLFAASVEKSDSQWFYPGLGLLIAWALFTRRSTRFSVPVWSGAMLIAVLLGFGAQLGLKHAQHALERLDSALLSRFSRHGVDPLDSRTSIGSIGRLNLSGRIVLRLQSDGHGFPGYLREASYNFFRSPIWIATKPEFSGVVPETNDTTWILLPHKRTTYSVTIGQYLSNGRGLLAMPTGAAIVEQLAGAMETNRFGAVKIDAAPGCANYVVRHDLGETTDSRPEAGDLVIPPAEEAALSQVAAEVGLTPGMEVSDALHKLAAFFTDHFNYSTYLALSHKGGTNETPLTDFLLRKRSGHCEYFATATVLLLRKAGIPARYAVGYSVQEIKGAKAIVRERHAHAWCLVHVNGIWQDFDTTPGSWVQTEAKHAHFWEPLSDACSRLWFEFSIWRYGASSIRRYVPWLVAPLVVLLVAQLLLRKRSREKKAQAVRAPITWPGLDSELYRIEQCLAAKGFARRLDECWSDWLRRIAAATPPDTIGALPEILSLHYRHRFDPLGISENDRSKLTSLVDEWLRVAAVPLMPLLAVCPETQVSHKLKFLRFLLALR